jgi:C4-dicarboxylate transporter DctM subunit
MSPFLIGALSVILFLMLATVGVPVAFSLAVVGFLGMWYLQGLSAALSTLGTVPYTEGTHLVVIILPLFILMGYFAAESGLVEGSYKGIQAWIGHFPGGLAIATVGACAAFGACSGAVAGTTALMGKVSLPEMRKYGYAPQLSVGCVAASGTIAALIPPSAFMVLIGLLTQQSVGKLLVAGLAPGIMEAILYGLLIVLMTTANPTLAGRTPRSTWTARLSSLKLFWEVFVLGGIIIVGLYTGLFTATEAAAIACFVALLLGFLRRLTWSGARRALLESGVTTCMIFMLIIGSIIFSQFLAVTGLPFVIGEFLVSLEVHRLVVLGIIVVVFIVFGTLMDDVAMLFLVVPIVFPIAMELGFHPIWFGLVLMKFVEMAIITPPIGMNLFVIAGVAPDISLMTIWKGVLPFFIVDFLCLCLYVALPQIVLFLPSTMM